MRIITSELHWREVVKSQEAMAIMGGRISEIWPTIEQTTILTLSEIVSDRRKYVDEKDMNKLW